MGIWNRIWYLLSSGLPQVWLVSGVCSLPPYIGMRNVYCSHTQIEYLHVYIACVQLHNANMQYTQSYKVSISCLNSYSYTVTHVYYLQSHELYSKVIFICDVLSSCQSKPLFVPLIPNPRCIAQTRPCRCSDLTISSLSAGFARAKTRTRIVMSSCKSAKEKAPKHVNFGSLHQPVTWKTIDSGKL